MTRRDLPLFAYGTMLDPDVLAIVLGRGVDSRAFQSARLQGKRRVRLPAETYPTLRDDAKSHVDGVLVSDLSAQDWQRVAFFESAEYTLRECQVTVGDGSTRRALYCFEDADPDAVTAWDLPWWQHQHKASHLEVFSRYMALYGRMTAEQADVQWEIMMADIAERRESPTSC